MFDCGGPSAEPEKPPNRAGDPRTAKKNRGRATVPKEHGPLGSACHLAERETADGSEGGLAPSGKGRGRPLATARSTG